MLEYFMLLPYTIRGLKATIPNFLRLSKNNQTILLMLLWIVLQAK